MAVSFLENMKNAAGAAESASLRRELDELRAEMAAMRERASQEPPEPDRAKADRDDVSGEGGDVFDQMDRSDMEVAYRQLSNKEADGRWSDDTLRVNLRNVSNERMGSEEDILDMQVDPVIDLPPDPDE